MKVLHPVLQHSIKRFTHPLAYQPEVQSVLVRSSKAAQRVAVCCLHALALGDCGFSAGAALDRRLPV